MWGLWMSTLRRVCLLQSLEMFFDFYPTGKEMTITLKLICETAPGLNFDLYDDIRKRAFNTLLLAAQFPTTLFCADATRIF